MKKITPLLPLLGCLVALSACTTGIQDKGNTDKGTTEEGQVTLRLSSFFSDREADVIEQALVQFQDQHPNITVEHTGGQTRDVQLQGMRGGDGFDVLMYGQSTDVASLCKAGSFISLEDYMSRDDITPDIFVDAVMEYTAWEDDHCALPMLSDVYALYYNKELFAEAGVEPPETWDDLAEVAQQLTVKSDNGSLERVGFMPLLDYGQMNARTMTPPFDLDWVGEDGTAQLADDPNWAEMLTWQKSLINFYGQDELLTFRSGLGDEFSVQHPFYTEQIAMMVEGEWRVAFLENEMPDLEYGVVPLPAINPDKAGGGYISGTVLGVPNNSNQPDAAWQLVKFLATDEDVLEFMTTELRNVPTTIEALNNETLRENEQWAALMDITLNPNSRTVPNTLAGIGPSDLFTQNVGGWQSSGATDPSAFLESIDDQVDALLEQSSR